MIDLDFNLVFNLEQIPLNNKIIHNTILVQKQKIDENREIKVTKCSVLLVIKYTVYGTEHITDQGEIYMENKKNITKR